MAAVVAASVVSGEAMAAQGQDQGQHYVERLRLQAQLETLNADLLSQDSATAVLQALCDRRDPASPRIAARRIQADDQAASDEVRAALGVGPAEPLEHRRVELTCGALVLSRADNWYVPGRLTARMNDELKTTDHPFGRVVAALAFQRHTLAADRLFQPLPPGWEATADGSAFDTPVRVPAEVLRHRAVLQTPDGRPFALLVETYQAGVLLP